MVACLKELCNVIIASNYNVFSQAWMLATARACMKFNNDFTMPRS